MLPPSSSSRSATGARERRSRGAIGLRVAITGAAGRVGAHLAQRLAADPRGHEIISVCRNFLAAMKLAESGCSVRIGSIADPLVAPRLLDGCEVVVHFARSPETAGRPDSYNLGMIQNIARVSSVKTLIFSSSVAVFGNCIESGVDQWERPSPTDAYGKEKLACERAALREFSGQGRRAIALRMGHVYGAFQTWSGQILNLARDSGFRLPFAGRLLSNAISIDQVCAAIAGLLDSTQAGIYNLTDQPQRTWGEVFAWHAESCGLPAVAALGDDESARIRLGYFAAKRPGFGKLGREMTAALRTAAIQVAGSNPRLKGMATALVARAPEAIQSTIIRRYKRAMVKQINPGRPQFAWDPWLGWLFSDPAPGPALDPRTAVPCDPARDSAMRRDLSRWFTRWATPDGLWRDQLANRT